MKKLLVSLKLVSLGLLFIVYLMLILLSLPKNSWKALSVQTGSMRPAINPGALVIVHRIPASKIKIGDVITYTSLKNKKQTITHRVLSIHGPQITVKGDANKVPDPTLLSYRVVGKVNYSVPHLGKVVDFIYKPIGLLLLIYIPALIIAIEEIKRLAKYYQLDHPYRLLRYRNLKSKSTLTSEFAGKLGLLVLVAIIAGGAAALPVRAALLNTATLTGNTISAIQPTVIGHVLIRQLKFECSSNNTTQLNNLPQILIYNPTNRDLSGGNWTLRTSNRMIVTFRPQTIFDSKSNYDIEPDLTNGLKYAGDSLGLYNNLGQLVDGISWGTDTSQFNPPLPTPAQQTQYRRVSVTTDTNTAADWAVSVQGCETGN